MTNVHIRRRGEQERNTPVFEVCVSFGLLYGIHLFVEMLRIQVMGPTKHSQTQKNKCNAQHMRNHDNRTCE